MDIKPPKHRKPLDPKVDAGSRFFGYVMVIVGLTWGIGAEAIRVLPYPESLWLRIMPWALLVGGFLAAFPYNALSYVVFMAFDRLLDALVERLGGHVKAARERDHERED